MPVVDNPTLGAEVLRASDAAVGRVTAGIASRAQQLAPRATGEMANSIHARRVAEGHHEVAVGTDHWAPVEYGHRLVAWGHETGRSVPARPFMRPALSAGGQA